MKAGVVLLGFHWVSLPLPDVFFLFFFYGIFNPKTETEPRRNVSPAVWPSPRFWRPSEHLGALRVPELKESDRKGVGRGGEFEQRFVAFVFWLGFVFGSSTFGCLFGGSFGSSKFVC